jgi:hypothetical protein
MKSAGFVSALNLTGQSTIDLNANQTMVLLQNKIRTLTALSNRQFLFLLRQIKIVFIYLAIDSNVQYVEQGKYLN